jgi:hypothetical protein
MAAKDTFERKTFTTSRLAEFSTETELTKQIGHPVVDWPLVILKEAVDNALDEAEEAGVPPVIEISVEPGSITSSDSGRGIRAETVEKLIDYSARTSSRAAYASPTRGAQGNALQTIIAMPFALASRDCETVVIESQGRVRRMVTGLNFSASVGANPFRELRDRQGLDGLLNQQYAGPDEPVIVFVHLTTPRLQFLDKGKSSVALP